MVPAASITSRSARTEWSESPSTYSAPRQRVSVEHQPPNPRVRDHREIRAVHGGLEIRVGGALPTAVDDVRLRRGDAFDQCAVAVFRPGVACLEGGLVPGQRERPWEAGPANDHRTIGAPDGGITALGALGSPQVGQHRVVVPSGGAQCFPGVVARLMTAEMHHRVDAAGPAEHLAERPAVDRAVGSRLRSGRVPPVDRRSPQAEGSRRICHLLRPFGRTCLQQHHAGVGTL